MSRVCMPIALATAIVWPRADVAAVEQAIGFRVLEHSFLFDPSGGPPIPMSGRFELRRVEETPELTRYDVELIVLRADVYDIRGAGEYVVRQDVENAQRMTLNVTVNGRPTVFDSGDVPLTVPLPLIDIALIEYDPDGVSHLQMYLVGAIWRNIWFSTEIPFHSGTHGGAEIKEGDLLSTLGRVVRTNEALVERFDIVGGPRDLGLDAIAPLEVDQPPRIWWAMWFSMEVDATSASQGPLQHGDLLAELGYVVARNQDLTAALEPVDPERDYGLDAVAAMGPDGTIWFSTEEGFWTVDGVWCGHGDILDARGLVVMTNDQLLANFQPDVEADYGLDALYVWPTGEIWFSTEEPFHSLTLGDIGDGDLLSVTGRIIARNPEILARFEPLEDLDNFGLDAVSAYPFGIGDFDEEGDTDIVDFATFATCYSGSGVPPEPGCHIADLDFDGDVDVADFATFTANYTGSQ